MSSLNIKKGGFPGVRSSERFTGSNFRFRFQNCLSAVVAIFSFPFFSIHLGYIFLDLLFDKTLCHKKPTLQPTYRMTELKQQSVRPYLRILTF